MERIEHIAIVVGSIEKALAWYREQFDVAPVYVDDSWALLRFGNVALALVLPGHRPPHFAIERADADASGPLTPHRDGTATVYVEDPWGNAIEIMQAQAESGVPCQRQ